MPLLATGSAEVQGKALVEVCTVYGMSMLSVDRSDKAPGPDAGTAPKPADSIAHLDHHCVLTALAALATADDPAPFPTAAAPRSSTPRPATPAARPGHDAAAAWLAGRKQGPPTVS